MNIIDYENEQIEDGLMTMFFILSVLMVIVLIARLSM